MQLKKSILLPNQTVQISGSKSISNRLIILNALFHNIKMENLSDAKDTQLLLQAIQSDEDIIDIHHAGTAMRFLTSYFSIVEGKEVVLTGSSRMKQRPIAPLVDALRQLGASIEYEEKEGFPPLRIKGEKLLKSNVQIESSVSSQFITSLMLIGAKMPNGMNIELLGEITSRPYIVMTLRFLKNVGIDASFIENKIQIRPLKLDEKQSSTFYMEVESDWSSASYFYSLSALSRKPINLKSFTNQSYQGDSILKEIYWDCFGVNTVTDLQEHQITLLPEIYEFPESIKLNLNNAPDIAQTIAVTAAILQIPFELTGLATLKVKETDRLIALQNELEKLGCKTEITEQSIKSTEFISPQLEVKIATYEDHRMAMSFAPYLLKADLNIENPQVVEKSYPNFWKDLSKITQAEE